MHGAKLSREAVIGGLSVWRLHLAVFASTYVLFPILGVALTLLPDGLLDPEIKMGMMFLCILPSTVQSSIAFTSMARGNVPARSEEHTSELQSLMRISYAVFCLKKKKEQKTVKIYDIIYNNTRQTTRIHINRHHQTTTN